MRLIAPYCALLRLIAPYCALLRPMSCCTCLWAALIAPFCVSLHISAADVLSHLTAPAAFFGLLSCMSGRAHRPPRLRLAGEGRSGPPRLAAGAGAGDPFLRARGALKKQSCLLRLMRVGGEGLRRPSLKAHDSGGAIISGGGGEGGARPR